MQVAVSALRADLATWIARARDGEDIVVTDRGLPVARLVPVESASLLDRLTRDGTLAPPRNAARPAARSADRVVATGPVADLVEQQRR